MRLWLVLVLGLLVRAEEPAEPASTPVPEPPPAEDTTPPAEEVLAEATQALVERRFADALAISLPAISTYPTHRESFEAVARIATNQLARGEEDASGSQPVPPRPPPARPPPVEPGAAGSGGVAPWVVPPEDGDGPGDEAPPGWNAPPPPDTSSSAASGGGPQGPDPQPPPRPAPAGEAQPGDVLTHRSSDPRNGLMVGFDLGAPTGLRVEWKAKGSSVDGVGVRIGENFFVYQSSLFLNPELMVYADFGPSTWQVEVATGASFYYGSPYPMVGVAAQYDPPEPLQANIGMRVGRYLSITPDIGVSFIW